VTSPTRMDHVPARGGLAGAPQVARFVADFLGPQHDAPVDRLPTRPVKTYIVCSTPRSGSGLLCRGLAGTGGLGTPLEYFNPVHRGILTERWRCGPDLESYVDAMHSRRTATTGLFGAKVHWDQMAQVRAEAGAGTDDRLIHKTPDALLERLFPAPLFIRIVRLDLDRQAVSYWRALNSNVWSVDIGDPAGVETDETPYDFEGIDRCRRLIERGELRWDRLIRGRGDNALVVTYEELTSAFARTVELVAGHISPGITVTVPAPRTRQLSDERSPELIARFRAERVERS
jgi:trehalose 2-sulfotransferase